MYNEPMLQQAGIKAPAKTWDELVEHCLKLKRTRSATPRSCRNWNNSGSGTMPQFMSDCFSEGANVFDAKNRLLVDQEPGAARVLERWQKVYKEGLVEPRGATKTSSTDTHRLFWPGRYAYHTNHSYYLKTSPASRRTASSPQEGQDGHVPGQRPDPHVHRVLHDERQDKGGRGLVEAPALPRREPQRRLVRPAPVVPHRRPRQPLPEMYDHPEIMQSYDSWVDLKLLREQYKKGRIVNASRSPGTASTTPRPSPSSTT